METSRKSAKTALSSLLLLLFLSSWGCTVTPVQTRPKQASFDGLVQNSGIIDRLQDNSYIVTGHWRDRYNGMQGVYGMHFDPPLVPDYGVVAYTNGTFRATPEAVQKFNFMNHWRKNGRK